MSRGAKTPPTRRGFLAAPFLLPVIAQAQGVDDSLSGVVRRGVLRVNIAFWTASFVRQPEPDPPGLRDSFHDALARLIAQQLGVRAELLPARESGQGAKRLIEGHVDLALAPPITRGLLRQIMFCAPHLHLDLVVLVRGGERPERGRQRLQGMRLGALTVLATSLADRGTLASVMPVPTPWLLLQHLLEGQLDGAILTSVSADSALRQLPELGLRVQQSLATATFAGAVAYGAHDLRRAVNLAIDQLLMDGRLAALFRRETGLPFNPPYPD
ncbi:transporter substrate-binding domain-containing protein [Roseococcus sp. SDR]|uniref:substrate-binding periplasmic protein n=1 Tax=Roseococcus sp. SDR TaxID=2835532 RepID=UPI001BCAA8CF|nr:transporter substrate-binding domain-containing protein [Roseococcus sp. SDR]MBS7792043.1 transporter substrate-binding domain-containing protein [Roseococcus sp. SDR]MBV1847357.1 transporter substrate-binding domain-containing protein [Roseococcus sp. SDR]